MPELTLIALLLAAVVAAYLLRRRPVARRPAKAIAGRQARHEQHTAEARRLAAIYNYRPGSAERRQFEQGYVAGMWFVASDQGEAAIRETFIYTLRGLATEIDHKDLGWLLAVQDAYEQASAQWVRDNAPAR